MEPDLENIGINLDAFCKAIQVLTVHMRTAGENPAYEALAKYGDDLYAQAEILDKNLNTPGFFITCAHPNLHQTTYSDAQFGFHTINFANKEYYCIGDDNYQLFSKLNKVLKSNIVQQKIIERLKTDLTLKIELLETEVNARIKDHRYVITSIGNALTTNPEEQLKLNAHWENRFKNKPMGKTLTQLEKELELVCKAEKIAQEINSFFYAIIEKTAPLRDKAFWVENAEWLEQ